MYPSKNKNMSEKIINDDTSLESLQPLQSIQSLLQRSPPKPSYYRQRHHTISTTNTKTTNTTTASTILQLNTEEECSCFLDAFLPSNCHIDDYGDDNDNGNGGDDQDDEHYYNKEHVSTNNIESVSNNVTNEKSKTMNESNKQSTWFQEKSPNTKLSSSKITTIPESQLPQLDRFNHIHYLQRPLLLIHSYSEIKKSLSLPSSFVSLDSSRTWILYWTLHGLDLLGCLHDDDDEDDGEDKKEEVATAEDQNDDDSSNNNISNSNGSNNNNSNINNNNNNNNNHQKIDETNKMAIVMFIKSCWSFDTHSDYESNVDNMVQGGGFGGGPGQIPHAATTYASILSLVILAGGGSGGRNRTKLGTDTKESPYSSSSSSSSSSSPTAPPSSVEALTILRSKCQSLEKWFETLRVDMSDHDTNDNDYNENDDNNEDTTTTMMGHRMHHDGEIDIRATYCVLSISSLLRIDIFHPSNTTKKHTSFKPQYSYACQTTDVGTNNGTSSNNSNDNNRKANYPNYKDDDDDIGSSATSPIKTSSIFSKTTISNSIASIVRYIATCQTYEGGFGGECNAEAHGGYAFCAVSSLWLLGLSSSLLVSLSKLSNHPKSGAMINTSSTTNYRPTNNELLTLLSSSSSSSLYNFSPIDLKELRGWLCRRQMSYEGGFSGRSNKLVDGCYTFWMGGAIAILDMLEDEIRLNDRRSVADSNDDDDDEDEDEDEDENDDDDTNNDDNSATRKNMSYSSYDINALRSYVLCCCQDPKGGLRDKPTKARDFYHTCYCLSGLALTTSSAMKKTNNTIHMARIHLLLLKTKEQRQEKEKVKEQEQEQELNEKSLTRMINNKKTKKAHRSKVIIPAKIHAVFNVRVERIYYVMREISKGTL